MKKHGEGILYFANGTKYVGSFESGSIQGKGMVFQDDVILYRGLWENGKLVNDFKNRRMTRL